MRVRGPGPSSPGREGPRETDADDDDYDDENTFLAAAHCYCWPLNVGHLKD